MSINQPKGKPKSKVTKPKTKIESSSTESIIIQPKGKPKSKVIKSTIVDNTVYSFEEGNNVNLTAFDNSTIKNTMNVESPTIVDNVILTATNASTIENITNSSFVESPTIVNNVILTATNASTIENITNSSFVESPIKVNNVNLTATNASTIEENITNSSFVMPSVGLDWKIKASVGLNVIFGLGAFYYINQQIKNIEVAKNLVDYTIAGASSAHRNKVFSDIESLGNKAAGAIYEAVIFKTSSHISGMGDALIRKVGNSDEYKNYHGLQVKMQVGVIFPVLNALSSLLTVGVMAMEEAAPIFTFAPILKDLSIGFASYHLYNANKAIDNQYVTALKYSAISHFITAGMNAPFALIAYDNHSNSRDTELKALEAHSKSQFGDKFGEMLYEKFYKVVTNNKYDVKENNAKAIKIFVLESENHNYDACIATENENNSLNHQEFDCYNLLKRIIDHVIVEDNVISGCDSYL